jgi:hypothetical protein
MRHRLEALSDGSAHHRMRAELRSTAALLRRLQRLHRTLRSDLARAEARDAHDVLAAAAAACHGVHPSGLGHLGVNAGLGLALAPGPPASPGYPAPPGNNRAAERLEALRRKVEQETERVAEARMRRVALEEELAQATDAVPRTGAAAADAEPAGTPTAATTGAAARAGTATAQGPSPVAAQRGAAAGRPPSKKAKPRAARAGSTDPAGSELGGEQLAARIAELEAELRSATEVRDSTRASEERGIARLRRRTGRLGRDVSELRAREAALAKEAHFGDNALRRLFVKHGSMPELDEFPPFEDGGIDDDNDDDDNDDDDDRVYQRDGGARYPKGDDGVPPFDGFDVEDGDDDAEGRRRSRSRSRRRTVADSRHVADIVRGREAMEEREKKEKGKRKNKEEEKKKKHKTKHPHQKTSKSPTPRSRWTTLGTGPSGSSFWMISPTTAVMGTGGSWRPLAPTSLRERRRCPSTATSRRGPAELAAAPRARSVMDPFSTTSMKTTRSTAAAATPPAARRPKAPGRPNPGERRAPRTMCRGIPRPRSSRDSRALKCSIFLPRTWHPTPRPRAGAATRSMGRAAIPSAAAAAAGARPPHQQQLQQHLQRHQKQHHQKQQQQRLTWTTGRSG